MHFWTFILLVWISSMLMSFTRGDVYLHVMRGSNNRLNEESAQRKNANRLFDSQNNNRGGYNVGDSGPSPSKNDADKQYLMKYFQSGPWKTMSNDEGKSKLTIEWTNQHGCGGNEDSNPPKQNCVMVLQYMCQKEDDSSIDDKDVIRNGVKTDRQPFTEPRKNNVNNQRKNGDVKGDRGLHESWDWYNKCYLRKRNQGLFTADQNLDNNKLGYSSAIHTRQNPTGTRYGYECPEERDYYPYWHPSPWADVAVLAENASMCSHYQDKSFNSQAYGECVESKGWSQYNNKEACEQNNGQWHVLYNYLEKAKDKRNKNACENTSSGRLKYKWAIPYDSDNYKAECLIMLDKPDCMEAPWSRSNHLGNGKEALPLNYTWTLPYFPSGETKRCVFRIRYNISTDDYDPYNTDHKHNDNFPMRKSPIENNPYVYVMKDKSALKLAVNTAQYGRVFQDRSHAFLLRERPSGLSKARIYNVNVRGKRGNIVQAYPAVEYDFAPNRLVVKEDDLVHFQWTGSNTHKNNNPAGDGQAGAAGEGREGTDRNNVVELDERSGNFPLPFDHTKLWRAVDVAWIYHGKTDVNPRDLAINMASAGYYHCADDKSCSEGPHKDYLVSTKTKMSNVLDNAPASYEGVLLKFKQKGIYNYMCTRNNSFTNRSQKAAVVVT